MIKKHFEVGKIYRASKSSKKYTYKIVARTLKSVNYIVLDHKAKEVFTAYTVCKNSHEAFKPLNFDGLVIA